MGKARDVRSNKKEVEEIQKLKQENQKLKRQLNRLRKQLARIDLDKFQNIRDVIVAQIREDEDYELELKQKSVKKQWQCHACQQDYLRLVILHRPDGEFYFRRCPSCKRRTKMQRLTEGVEGPRAS